MSYDIDMIEMADEEAGHQVGHYSDRLATHWQRALGQPLGAFHGITGLVAAPFLARGLAFMLATPHEFEQPTDLEGEYEEAVLALATIWQACRLNEDRVLSINY